MNLVAASHAGTVHHADVRVDNTIVANDYVVFYICERKDGNVLSNLCLGTYYCFIANHILMFELRCDIIFYRHREPDRDLL